MCHETHQPKCQTPWNILLSHEEKMKWWHEITWRDPLHDYVKGNKSKNGSQILDGFTDMLNINNQKTVQAKRKV